MSNFDIPILGEGLPVQDRFDREYGGVHNRESTARGDIQDSELLDIERVYKALGQKNGQRRELDAFEREIKERFHEIGFAVDVAWFEFAIDGVKQEGCFMPEISIVGRVEKTEFDHDQKVAEVTRNILELPGEGGVIKSEGLGLLGGDS